LSSVFVSHDDDDNIDSDDDDGIMLMMQGLCESFPDAVDDCRHY